MFSKTEKVLIEELREQDAPLERWAKFFPEKTIGDLLKAGEEKPIHYLYGKPVYANEINPCSEIPLNPQVYAASMKKGNIYRWDVLQDSYLIELCRCPLSMQQVIYYLEKRFGIKRTPGAIESRLSSLGYKTQ